MKARHMLALGSVIPVIFWSTITVCGYVMGDYSHLTRLVSELGAIGTRTQYMFTAGLIASAVLSVLFVIGLCRECKKREISTIPALIILSFSLSIGGAAIFPLPSHMHLIMGLPSVLLFLSPLAALVLWRADKHSSGLRVIALVGLLIMLLGFTAFMPGVLGSMPGLKQRLFHLGWSFWFIGLSRAFIRSLRSTLARKSGSATLIVSMLIMLAGCVEEEQPHARITLNPTNASVHVSRSLQFSATVTNSTNTVLAWTVSGNGCTGASCGTVSDSGLYTAPAVIPSPDKVMIKVTSVTDSISAYVWATILPAIGLTVTPPDPTVAVDSDLQFTANIRNALDGRVDWAVSGPGTISQTGRYTAPSVVPAVPTVTITATSVEDPFTSASATALIASSCVSVEWAWESGGIYYNQYGVYGTRGIPSPSNVPGARKGAVSWHDPNGSLWLFGGSHRDYTFYNDLWRYDPASREWTWVSGSNIKNQLGSFGTQGVSDPSNVPGARCDSVSWIDSNGNLWLFGGDGIYPNAYQYGNDLWKYDPATNEWTWMSGADRGDPPGIYGTMGVPDPANVPGGRCLAVAWRDASGNFWLFGGRGLDAAGHSGILNDVWKYDPTTNQWTWSSGGDIVNQAGVYGIKGVPDPANSPGARYRAASCVDHSGVLWLFGGSDWDYFHLFNDLWKFDPATQLWTWVSGSDTGGQAGVYGSRGVTDPAGVPGGRAPSVLWVDPYGLLWLFGGAGLDSTGENTVLNDLWMFDPSTLQWTWVSGSKTGEQLGNYGIKGIADPSSVPGARYLATGGTDSLGRFWLFGGYSCDSVTCFGHINDLWSVIR